MRRVSLGGSVLASLFGLHSVAAADDHDPWFLGVVPSDQSREYIDAARLNQAGGNWEARVINVMPDDSQGFAVLASDVAIDCDAGRYRYEDGKSYDREAKILQAGVKRPTTWTPAAADAGTRQIQTFVCDGGDDGKHPEFQRAVGAEAALTGGIFADWSAVPPSTWTGGWSFAHWGMTRPEVEAAGKGLIHPDPGDTELHDIDDVDGEVAFGPYKFKVEVQFGSETDSSVLTKITFYDLSLAKGCAPVRAYLEQAKTFGTKELATKAYTAWTDTKNGNSVDMEDMGTESCDIYLTPLTSPDENAN